MLLSIIGATALVGKCYRLFLKGRENWKVVGKVLEPIVILAFVFPWALFLLQSNGCFSKCDGMSRGRVHGVDHM